MPRRLRRPFDRRVLQPSFDHFASQRIGVLTNRWVGHELMVVRPVSLDLLSNVFVEMSEPLVRHMFDTHDQLLLNSLAQRGFPFALARSLVGFFVRYLDMLLARRS
jgi:hypothetical protein